MNAAVEPTLREISDLPGPPGLPVLGNALQIPSGQVHLAVEGWQRKYGDYFRFRIGPRSFLAVADPEAIAAMLRDRPDGFQRTHRLNRTAREMGFGGVFSANGQQWRPQRPMVMAGFAPPHIKAFFPTPGKGPPPFAPPRQPPPPGPPRVAPHAPPP